MAGSLLGLAAAFSWAAATVAIRPVVGRCGAVSTNSLRLAFSAVLFVLLGVLTGGIQHVFDLSGTTYLLLLGSASSALLIGDTSYLIASRRLGVSRSLPISMSYPLLTAVLAVFVMGEPASLQLWLGGLLIVGGATMLGLPRDAKTRVLEMDGDPLWQLVGVGLAILSAVAYAASVLMLKAVVEEADLVTANLVRMAMAAIMSNSIALTFPNFSGSWPTGHRLALTFIASVAGVAASICFYGTIMISGAARAALLNGSAPLFAAPLTWLFLKERLTARLLLGVVSVAVGIALVV